MGSADSLLVVFRAALVALEDPDELVPFAAVGVENLEIVPAPEGDVALLQLLLGAPVVRLQGEQQPVGFYGALFVLQAIAGDLPELVQ